MICRWVARIDRDTAVGLSASEWLLLIVVVIGIPLVIAGAVTLWSLEQIRARNRRTRKQPGGIVVRSAASRLPAPEVEHPSANAAPIAPVSIAAEPVTTPPAGPQPGRIDDEPHREA